MSDPVEQKEPTHPGVKEELEKRLSLVEAFQDEIKLMCDISETEKLNKQERAAAKMVSYALRNIMKRWTKGSKFHWDSETLSIVEE